jgi:hypothetical protein
MQVLTNAGKATVTESHGKTTIEVLIPNGLRITKETTEDVLVDLIRDLEYKDTLVTRRR